MNKGRRAYAELFLEYADFDLNCDGQGRVVIPEKLRKQGKLGEKVLLRGCFDHLQIWDVAEHEKYRADREGYSKERREQMETAFEEMRKG